MFSNYFCLSISKMSIYSAILIFWFFIFFRYIYLGIISSISDIRSIIYFCWLIYCFWLILNFWCIICYIICSFWIICWGIWSSISIICRWCCFNWLINRFWLIFICCCSFCPRSRYLSCFSLSLFHISILYIFYYFKLI